MQTNQDQKVINSITKKLHSKSSNQKTVPIRINQETKQVLDKLLANANKYQRGRKIKSADLICFSLKLLKECHLQEIGESLLSNKDRLELLYEAMARKNKSLTKDKFYGLLLDDKADLWSQKS